MNRNAIQIDASGDTCARTGTFFRGVVEGAAGLFDIFRSGACHRVRGTPEDDARELRGDVERIAQDFHAVLSTIGPATK